MAKRTLKKKSSPDVVRYVVGTGITKRPRVSVKVDLSRPLSPEAESILDRKNRYSRSRDGDPFNASIAGIEQSTKKILENVGLPFDPRKNYNINFDWNLNGELPDLSHLAACHQTKYPDGSLLGLVESRGYKEYSCIEWYAAKILSLINKVRYCIEQALPADAAWCSLDLGFLINEGDWKNQFEKSILAHERVRKGASKPKPPKALAGVKQFIRDRLAKNQNLTAGALWAELARYDENAPCVLGQFELYRDGEKLVQADNRHDASIKFDAFKKYVSRLKKEGK